MQNPTTWVKGLSSEGRRWAFQYLQKRVNQFPELNHAWQGLPQSLGSSVADVQLEVERLISLVATLQGAYGGAEQFRKMENAWSKKLSRGGGKRVERNVVLDREYDKALQEIMRQSNVDRSTAIMRCIEQTAEHRSDEWEDIKYERSRLQERRDALSEGRDNLKRSRKELADKIHKLRDERNKARKELKRAEEEGKTAWDGLYSLIWALSLAPHDAAVEFKFDDEKRISGIRFQEGTSRVKVWSKPVRRKLNKALEPFMGKKPEATDEAESENNSNDD